jgi:hypothetical protein
MTILSHTAETYTRPRIAWARSHGYAATSSTCLVLACMLVALAPAGCSASSATASPTAGATPTLSPIPSLTSEPTRTTSLTASPTPAPSFVATGWMTSARWGYTATVLADDRVLIAGGTTDEYGGSFIAPAELYDPTIGTFSPTGSMTSARRNATAALLPDGRVLIAGGVAASGSTYQVVASAELYDPTTGIFSPTGSMTRTRDFATSTSLSDGRVLIAGGSDASATSLASAELYNLKTGEFIPTGSMTAARINHTSTLLSDGRVLIAGGGNQAPNVSFKGLASAELYNPKTGRFSPTGSMTIVRVSHTATRISDGRVLMAGGDNGGWGPSAELYDMKTGKFSPTGSMTDSRVYDSATLLLDGRVLIAGGLGPQGARLSTAEIYDPNTGAFSPTGSMTQPRSYHTAALLSDGRVLIAGGGFGSFPSQAELFQP